MTNDRLGGVIAAIATPFDAAGEPDLSDFVRLGQHLLASGCDALNVCGTTGEATSMSVNQRRAVMEAAARHLPRERLMVGTGATALADAQALTAYAGELGFAGALLLPPFYYKGVSDDGVAAYVEACAAAAPATLPLYLYHFPALSGVPFHPALVARLRRVLGQRLAGLKDFLPATWPMRAAWRQTSEPSMCSPARKPRSSKPEMEFSQAVFRRAPT